MKRKIKKKQEQQIYLAWLSESTMEPMVFYDLESLTEFVEELVLDEELELTKEFIEKINIVNVKEIMLIKSIEKIKEGVELKLYCVSPSQYVKVISEIEEEENDE